MDDARGGKFELLKCIESDSQLHAKFVRTFSTLANASDIFKLPIENYDEECLAQVKSICEEWGKLWTVEFPHRNMTPKGHILSFVLPKIAEEWGTFYRFYKVEQKGESIHADMNDIARKTWCVRKKEDRLWKLIERYEHRNVTNVEIVIPVKRFKKADEMRTHRYI